jgi:hypothetical protein
MISIRKRTLPKVRQFSMISNPQDEYLPDGTLIAKVYRYLSSSMVSTAATSTARGNCVRHSAADGAGEQSRVN